MTLKPMGTPTAHVSTREAAKILGVTTRTLFNLSRQGLLRPTWKGKKKFFDRGDLLAFMKVFNGKTDWSSIAALAMRAYIKAEANERKLEEISDLLGLGMFTLEADDVSVKHFYDDVCERNGQDPTVLSSEAMLLAKRCLALTEEYLQVVARVTGSNEPWRPFIETLQHLCENAPRRYFTHDLELAAAYGYLEAARRHMRPLAYFYVRRTNGCRVADQAFGTQPDYAAPILRAMFPS